MCILWNRQTHVLIGMSKQHWLRSLYLRPLAFTFWLFLASHCLCECFIFHILSSEHWLSYTYSGNKWSYWLTSSLTQQPKWRVWDLTLSHNWSTISLLLAPNYFSLCKCASIQSLVTVTEWNLPQALSVVYTCDYKIRWSCWKKAMPLLRMLWDNYITFWVL